MFCIKCGARIADGAAFCQNCGAAAAIGTETNRPYVNTGNGVPTHSSGIGPDFNAANGNSMNVLTDTYHSDSGFHGNSYQNPNYSQNREYQSMPNVGDINSAKYTKPDEIKTGDVIGSILIPLAGIIYGIYFINTGRPKAGKTYLYLALMAWIVFTVIHNFMK